MHAWTQHPTETQRRNGQHWRCLTWSLAAVLALLLLAPSHAQAKTFQCGAGDVDCLITAIETANASGKTNTIRLKAAIYTLTEANNGTSPGDSNGLPVITSTLTILGAGAATTIIERDTSAEAFRLLKVGATGALTLEGLTVRGGDIIETAGGGNVGGGIYNAGTLTLTNCTLTNNLAYSAGGGIYNAGTLTLTNCSLIGNDADGGGGGLHNAGGTVTFTNCSLIDNAGSVWGAGGAIANAGGPLTLTNCTLTGNTASSGGGGIINAGGTVTLTNCTLTGNTASPGGGIYNPFGSVTLQNTILALNTASDTSSDDCGGNMTSLGNNLTGALTGCPTHPNDLQGDPHFSDFTDNDRPGTEHFPLLPTSPAIDAANDAVCPQRDQLGQPRKNIPGVGTSRCDIGAIEFQ